MSIALLGLLALPIGSPALLGAQDGTPSPNGAESNLGLTRSEPAPLGEEVITDGYGVTVIEALFGDAAAQRVAEANPSAPSLIEELAYVLVNVKVRNVGESDEAIGLGPTHFGLTASGNRLYPAATVTPPEPALTGQLFAGGEAEGWLILVTGIEETDHELVVLPGNGDDSSRFRYLALDIGTSIAVAPAPASPVAVATPDAAGARLDNPAAAGESVETGLLRVEVVETTRGEEATAALKEVTEFNPDPLPSNEHFLVRVRVTAVGAEEGPIAVSPADFGLVGAGNVRYAQTALVPPQPDLNVRLYRGGTAEGWLAFEIGASDRELRLIVLARDTPRGEERFLLLPETNPGESAPDAEETPAA